MIKQHGIRINSLKVIFKRTTFHICFFPTGVLDLNPTEECWNQTRAEVTANKSHNSKEQLLKESWKRIGKIIHFSIMCSIIYFLTIACPPVLSFPVAKTFAASLLIRQAPVYCQGLSAAKALEPAPALYSSHNILNGFHSLYIYFGN